MWCYKFWMEKHLLCILIDAKMDYLMNIYFFNQFWILLFFLKSIKASGNGLNGKLNIYLHFRKLFFIFSFGKAFFLLIGLKV